MSSSFWGTPFATLDKKASISTCVVARVCDATPRVRRTGKCDQ
jgi:hypothetical protein